MRGQEGFYHYRQYSAVELAERYPVEDVWRLLIDGALPADDDERTAFALEARAGRPLPPAVADVLPAVAVASASMMEALRTAVSLLASARGLRPVHDLGPAELRTDVIGLGAAVPVLTASLSHAARRTADVAPRDDLGHGAHLLWLLHGVEPDPERARALEQYLVLTIDHGFNASTFTARVIASTGSDAGACFTGALGALAGPLHGGAPRRVLDLLDEIEAAGADRMEAILAAKLAGRERLMGFGHGVYRTTDPRSTLLRRDRPPPRRSPRGPVRAAPGGGRAPARRALPRPSAPGQRGAVRVGGAGGVRAAPRAVHAGLRHQPLARLGRPRRRAGRRAQADPPERPLRRTAGPRPLP